MGPTCPECQVGKHQNCNGVGGVAAQGELLIKCACVDGEHPARTYFLDSKMFQEEVQPILNGPPDEGSIWGDAFPELTEADEIASVRLRPQSEVIRDLRDLEVLNSKGEWVPIVPMALHEFFGIITCLCGKRRFGEMRYQEHYAYAHILGMED